MTVSNWGVNKILRYQGPHISFQNRIGMFFYTAHTCMGHLVCNGQIALPLPFNFWITTSFIAIFKQAVKINNILSTFWFLEYYGCILYFYLWYSMNHDFIINNKIAIVCLKIAFYKYKMIQQKRYYYKHISVLHCQFLSILCQLASGTK